MFALGLALIGVLIYSMDYAKIVSVTSRLSLFWIAALVLIQSLIMFLMSLRWYVIIRRYGVSFTNVFNASLIGFMVNSLTPVSYAGGEPARAYVISKVDKIKSEKAFATVFVDLFLALIPTLLFYLAAIALVLKDHYDMRLALILGIVGLCVSGFIALAMGVVLDSKSSMRVFHRIFKFLEFAPFFKNYVRGFESRLEELFMSFHRSIKATMTDSLTLCLGIFISSLIWVLTFFRVYMVFQALGLDIGFETVVIVYSVLIAVSVIPILPGALGMWEWVGTGLFTYFGVGLEASAVIVLVDRILFFWLPILFGLIAAASLGLDAKKIIGENMERLGEGMRSKERV
jgi:glycosyltransferase 2 family protein